MVLTDATAFVLGGETRAQYLARRLDYYPYYRAVNETLPSNAHVWLIDMRRDSYHLERTYFSDYFFEDFTLRRWVDAATTHRELWSRARAAGITHVLARHDVSRLRALRARRTRHGRGKKPGELKLVGVLGEGTTVASPLQVVWRSCRVTIECHGHGGAPCDSFWLTRRQ